MTKNKIEPKVSIITPVRAKDAQDVEWLHEAISSVAGQTFRDFEMIVVDDHSAASLEPVRERWKASLAAGRLRWYPAEQQGVSAARNQAAQLAKAPLLLPLDGDDLLAKTALERFLEAWDKRDGAGIIYSDVVLFGEDYQHVYLAEEYEFKKLLHATFMTVGCLHKKADWQRVGGWRLDMTQGLEDWEYWIALGELGVCGERLAEPLYYYRRHPRGRLQWLKANRDKWDRAYNAMRELHVDSYNGRYPVGCCGGSRRRTTKPAPVAMPVAARGGTVQQQGLVQMVYVGGRQGGFQLAAMPSRKRYLIPAAGALVEDAQTGKAGVHPQDVAWFRSVNQGRDFRVVDQPARAQPITQQAPPVPRAPQPQQQRPAEKATSWDPTVLEVEPLPEPQVTVSITDAAQELAEEHGLDWTKLQGSGHEGNILVSDVRAALDERDGA